MEDLTGQQLGDYHLYRRLGRGAMACVYLARQGSLDRQVALKVLNADLASDDSYVARFQNEARAAAALVHPNIVQIYEVGVASDRHFIAQEYVAGSNVGQVIQRQGQLEAGPTLDILRQVAAALCRAAEAGIVHRDIKPENLMLARTGEVKVADFGLARAGQGGAGITQAGVTMGTPLYMSPEQVEGRPVDARSDLYSLGVTAYHMLAGAPPFIGETPLSVAVQHLNSRAAPLVEKAPRLPKGLATIVAGLMSKAADDRPQGPVELLGQLRDLAAQAAVEGWSAGPENWPLHESMAIDAPSGPAAARLTELTARAEKLRSTSGRPGGRLFFASLACGVAGIVAAMLTGPTPLLRATPPGPTEKPTVAQQLFHAKLLDTEEGWRIVARRFPDADEYYHHQAREGLARHYLSRGQHAEAQPLCAELATLDNSPKFQRFGNAGLVICEVAAGNERRATRLLNGSGLIEALPAIRDSDPMLHGLIQEAMRRLRSGAAGG